MRGAARGSVMTAIAIALAPVVIGLVIYESGEDSHV